MRVIMKIVATSSFVGVLYFGPAPILPRPLPTTAPKFARVGREPGTAAFGQYFVLSRLAYRWGLGNMLHFLKPDAGQG